MTSSILLVSCPFMVACTYICNCCLKLLPVQKPNCGIWPEPQEKNPSKHLSLFKPTSIGRQILNHSCDAGPPSHANKHPIYLL
ncbi:hypothetical protein F5B18DRAFT_642421 [Nemania serpens]|nr:hypothetical protein F5B18DRAFT_642421 [Nemania serpens]